MRSLVATIMLICLAAFGASAEVRVALVIGNSDYTHQASLSNPVNDVAAMTATLTEIGYEVKTLHNLDEDGMERALADFSEQADNADVALVYYSGHGMEISNTNYLIPVDAELRKERDAKFEAVDLDYVRAAIEGASKLKVVILDACRDNTFLAKTRGGTRGLKRVVAQAGEVIAYSTAPGSVAQDGEPGGLSPYTRALTEKLNEAPDMDVRFLFTSLGAKTAEYAGVQQRPYTEFASIMPDGRLPIGAPRGAPEDGAFDRALSVGDVNALRSLVQDFPNHPRTPEALNRIKDADAAEVDKVVDAALLSQDRSALARAAAVADGHPRAADIAAALDIHRRTDAAIGSLDLAMLDRIYNETNEQHPRRSDIRSGLRRAIVSDSCAKLLAYRMICPTEVMRLAQNQPAAPSPSQPTVAALQSPASPAPAPAPAPKEEKKPLDILDVFNEDSTAQSLAKAAAVKVEWRQVALRALGYYRGPIDGDAGPGMGRAVDAWRSDLGLSNRGDLSPREVVALLKQGAERDPKARAYLGVMYGIGLGVALDTKKATKHLQTAQRAGDGDAAVYLKNLSANWN